MNQVIEKSHRLMVYNINSKAIISIESVHQIANQEKEELTCGNNEKTNTKYITPPITSNCQFFFLNFGIFLKAICTRPNISYVIMS